MITHRWPAKLRAPRNFSGGSARFRLWLGADYFKAFPLKNV
jgi:hypothetical protein